MRCLRGIVLALLAMLTSVAFAQTFRGTLSGVVIDPQGAIIANASIQLKNPATDTVIEGKSNNSGEFNFPELPPGAYELTVSFSGFRTQKIQDIDIAVSKVVNLKVEMNVGADNQVVNVEADTVQTDTTSSALVAVIDSKSVADMPMNGRDFTKMTHFAAGAAILSRSKSVV